MAIQLVKWPRDILAPYEYWMSTGWRLVCFKSGDSLIPAIPATLNWPFRGPTRPDGGHL